MALEVEDGTAKANGESYAAVADADTLLGNRGITLWATMSETEKEQALRRATAYMEQAYRDRWAGWRVSEDQALSWPRYEVPKKDAAEGAVYADDAVPPEVSQACITLAYKAAFGDLSPDLAPPKVRTKVGPIETEYAPGARQSKVYRSIDLLLAPLLKGGAGSSVPLVRA